MNRAEAIKVLFEINDACKSQLMSCVSIDQPNSQIMKKPDGFQIQLKCDMDSHSRKCLKTVADKQKLGLREEEGFVIMFKL